MTRSRPALLNLILFSTLCLVWGTTWLAIKIGLDDLPPFFAAPIRFVVATSVLALVRRRRRARRGGGGAEPHLFYFLLSFCWVTLPYGLVYWAEQSVASGLSAIIFATMPLYVAILSHYVLPGGRLDRGKGAGLVVGFLGIGVIAVGGHGGVGSGSPYAIAALALSPLCAAVASVAAKRRIASLDPVSMNVWMMGYGALFFLAASLLTERGETISFSGTALLSLLYLGMIGSAFAFVLYTWLLREETALKMSLIAYITPVIALFAGWLVRSETITPGVLVGTALVFGGVYRVTRGGGGSDEASRVAPAGRRRAP